MSVTLDRNWKTMPDNMSLCFMPGGLPQFRVEGRRPRRRGVAQVYPNFSRRHPTMSTECPSKSWFALTMSKFCENHTFILLLLTMFCHQIMVKFDPFSLPVMPGCIILLVSLSSTSTSTLSKYILYSK